MIPLNVKLDADGAYPDADPNNFGNVTSVGLLARGTVSGKGSVCVEITLPDGKKCYGETTCALFWQAASALKVRDEMNQQANKSNR